MKSSISHRIITVLWLLYGTLFAFQQVSYTEQGWQQISQNQLNEAATSFLKAIENNPDDARPYLALSYLEQLAGNDKKSWQWYEKALDRLQDPNPYIFAAILTERGQLSAATEENQGVYNVFQKTFNEGDQGGVLRAGNLEKMGKFYHHRGDFDKALEYYKQVESQNEWTLTGPFENISASGYNKVFKPEIEYNPDAEYEGKNGMPVRWFKINKIRSDQWVDFNRYFAEDQGIYYGNCFVYSEKKQSVQIRVGTSGSVKFFLNNQLILASEDENNNDLDTYIAATELQQGWNRLLIKCGHSEISQCNFLVRITSENGLAVKDLRFDTSPRKFAEVTDAPVELIPNFAERYFEKRIADNPDHIENYLLLAECYLRNDKAPEAERILLQALDKMPQSVLVKFTLIEAYMRGEKKDEMLSTVSSIFDTYPLIPLILQTKYQEYINSENIEKAEEMLQMHTRLLPESSEGMIMEMTLAFRKGDMEKGFAILNKAYEKFPEQWEIVYLSALLSIRTTQSYEGAIKIYQDYLENNHTENAYVQLASTYLNASNVDKYEETYLQMLEENPAATGIYFSLAKVFLQVQNYDKAEKYIRECLALCPTSSGYWALLGEIQQAGGNKKEAVVSYTSALKYNPKDYTSRERIRELQEKKPIFSYFHSNNIDSLINNAPDAGKYPNDEALYILDDTRMVVYKNGAYEKQMEILIKVFNNEGIDDMKEYWLPLNGYSEKLILEKAVTRKANGTEIKADNDDNELVFKSLEANDFIYIKWRIQSFNRGRLAHHFWEEVNFNYFYPASRISFSLLIDTDIPFKHKTQFMADKPTVKKTDEGQLYTWYTTSEPAIQGEYNMPSLDDIGKMLFISSIPDWEYLVEWYRDLAETKTKATYEVRHKVKQLLANHQQAGDMKKIEVIYNYITENINYSSVSFRQSGLIPQSAHKVLAQKIGDCKDVATLCIAMLKEAGIPAHYVLVNTYDEGLNKGILPSIDFNHAIVGVETNEGTIYMDLTAKNYPILTVPDNDIDAFALSISEKSSSPFYLDKNLFDSGITERKSHIKIDPDNGVIITRKSTKSGLAGASLRGSYRFKGHTEIVNDLTESLSDEFPNVKVEKFDIEDIDEIKPQINYNYTFSVPFYVTDAGNMKLIKLPWADNLRAQRSLSYEQREYEFQYRASSDTLIEEMEIELPQGYAPLNMQKETRFDSKISSYLLSMEVENGLLKASRVLINKKSIVTPAEYREFKEFYNKTIRTDSQQIILQQI